MGLSYMDKLIVNFLLKTTRVLFVISMFILVKIPIKSESRNALLSNLGKLIKENKKEIIFILLSLLVVIMALCYEVYNKEYYVPLRILYTFSIISLLVVMTTYVRELAKKSEDSYIRNYLMAIFYYIETSSFSIIVIQQILINNESNLIRSKISLEDLLFIIIQLIFIILMFFWWLRFYSQAKAKSKKNNIKTIDLIELKNIFLKSTLQSLTTVIALYGLTSWNISTTFQLLVFFIDAFVAFSYPILDMNKYIREKEIEFSEKNFTPIRPIDESKE